MPYISKERREIIDNTQIAETEGELNYLLTKIYINIINEKGESYKLYGEIRTDISTLIYFLHSNMSYFSSGIKLSMQLTYPDLYYTSISDIVNKHRGKLNVKLIIGALENSSSELYRRKIAPYEDKKIIENGDVY